MVVVPCESVSESDHAPPVAVTVVPEKSVEILLESSAVPEKVTLVVVNVAFALGELIVGAAGAVVSLLPPDLVRGAEPVFSLAGAMNAGSA